MVLHCPRDNKQMVIREAEGHIGHVCPACKGVWLPYKFLRSIQLSHQYSAELFLEELKNGQPCHSTLQCPERCGILGCSKTLQGITLDVCQDCGGVWFDRDELKDMLRTFPKYPEPPGMAKQVAADIGLGLLLSIFIG